MPIITYLKADNFETLAAYTSNFRNVVGPMQGREAVPQTLDEDGNTIPEVPACGDPSKWYASVLMPFAVPPSEAVEICDEAEGTAVCEVWA